MATKHGMTGTPEYSAWCNMRSRCRYKPGYIAKGTTVCDRWLHSFEAFLEDVGKKPSPELTLDRINNDGNYEPGNVRWATQSEQQSNKRNNSIWGAGIWQRPDGSFATFIQLRGKCFRLGTFDTQEMAVGVRKEFERRALPLLAQIAASKAETAVLKQQNDSDEFRRVITSDTVN